MDIDRLKKPSFFLISPALLSIVVYLWLFLPHIALRYSSTTVISLSYAFFVVLMLACGVVFVLARIRWSRDALIITGALCAIAVYGIIKGVLTGWPVYEVIKSAYEETAHLFLFILILLSRIATKDLTRAFITPLLWFTFINAMYSFYQYMYVYEFSELWFYEPLKRMGFELNEWSYERAGRIRATGFFTSPLDNMYILSIVCIYFALKTVKINWKYSFPLFFYLMVGYATSVRTFFVGLLVTFVFFLFYQRLGSRWPFTQLIVVPFLGIMLTYLGLYIYADRLDLSSLGRLEQLNQMVLLLLSNPEGLGFGSVGISRMLTFDSVYNAWFISLGLVGGLLLIYIYYWSSKKLLLSIPLTQGRNDIIVLLTLILFSVYLVYVSQMQYALNVSARWYYVVAAAVVINTLQMKRLNTVSADNTYA